ncbi:MAG TPA: DUF2958 domain-containing protein [Bosea sp. (in: a-proteobacteria)]|jgi:hypothetical protein|uniref:DUF2958 domain-containing protein n=1 Tax=Bosea sp. (in: a-proteobacteria) TaxID=1871050 RepID=UPI002DDD9CA7|nr:DUF2958 domain-containing protein [Bosea sp. (in: a-proteobacteria)]HEV2553237.1 DUF2958 domain-containing protein [Bosea sp. (in: a-proteobacteria)]
MELLRHEARERLIANGHAAQAGTVRLGELVPVVRLYLGDGRGQWLLAALDPADEDRAYGLVQLGIQAPHFAAVRLSDLPALQGMFDTPVQRDRYFRPRQSLAHFASDPRPRRGD